MSTLNDVKGNNQAFTPSLSEPNRGFVPSLSEPDGGERSRRESMYAGKGSILKEMESNRPQNTTPKKPEAISMTTGKPIDRKIPTASAKDHGFVKADLSSLPKYKPGEEEASRPKVRDATDVLKPGGEFDQYIERKKKEYLEFNKRMAMEAEISGKPLVNPDGTPVSAEEIAALTGDYSAENNNEGLNEVDIMGDMDTTPVAQNIPERKRTPMEINTPAPVKQEEVAKFEDEIPVYDENEAAADDYSEEMLKMDIENTVETTTEEPVQNDTSTEDDSVDLISEPETVTSEVKTVPADDNIEIETGYIQEGERVKGDTLEDEEKEVEDASDTMSIEKRREILKNLVREKIKPAVKRIDLTSYTIAKSGTTESLNLNKAKSVSVVKWPLINTGICVKMKEFSGQELERLRISIEGNKTREVMQMIYDHITSPKPNDLDAWMKSIAFEDYDHLFFAIYCASFVGANYLPIECANKACKQKTYVTDNIPFMQMVKFKDDKVKRNFSRIYKEDPNSAKGLFPTEVVAISDNYAVSFITPSIYSTMMVSEFLDNDFIDKYRNTVATLPYIDNIYQIDARTHTLIPATWKEYSNNEGKTLKSRVIRYEHIFNSMTIDELAAIDGVIQSLNTDSNGVTYVYPEVTCPFCHQVTKEEPLNASVMVFRRSQLGRLVTS
ncbi:MAG TPA: hypothetical protein DCP07_08225 [Lachnospiraceae bacterium]|nr:hypothetical protein [Lachnospiraceae bacterium]